MGTRRIIMTKVPFNYRWPGANAVSCIRELGEALVKNEIADAAVARGHATELDGSTAPAPKKSRGATKAAKPATTPVDDAADEGQPAGVDRADLASDDRADSGAPVADAG